MRALFLIAVWIIISPIAAMAQSHFQIQHEPLRQFKKITPHSFILNDSINVKGKLNVPFDSKKLPNPEFKDKEFSLGQQAKGKLRNPATMPVLKPQGRYYMPVYKPDTTIQFTLLIKDYPRLQNKEAK